MVPWCHAGLDPASLTNVRIYIKGDELILKEWDPKTKQYTGRELTKIISFVLKTKDCKFWKIDSGLRRNDTDRFWTRLASRRSGPE